MKQMWLVRHGESKSQTGEDDDQCNPPLSDRGREQAIRLRDRLADLAFDRTLVSPLMRAWQTFELSGVDRASAEFDSRVMESEWGNPDFYVPVLPLTVPDSAATDRHLAYGQAVEQRATAVIEEFLEAEEVRWLVFGHWGVCGRLFAAFVGADVHDWSLLPSMDNTGISVFEVDDAGRRWVRYWNDRSHVVDLLD